MTLKLLSIGCQVCDQNLWFALAFFSPSPTEDVHDFLERLLSVARPQDLSVQS
jgi:hypothetical protein